MTYSKLINIFKYSFFSLYLCCLSCDQVPSNQKNDAVPKNKNEVLVLGAIHSGHKTDTLYNVEFLEKLILEINPDYILAEIPPDRMAAAMEGFLRDDTISEPRVMRFPEYVDVVFPLTKRMDFEIIPTAGWTRPMALARRDHLNAVSKDPERADDWAAYTKANELSDAAYEATGKVNDPYFIHTHAYDSIQDISLQVYNRLFNLELGLGGWENINIAHYWNIQSALIDHRYEGKRFLIIYGAGHKGWFLRQLRKRDDITLLEMKPFLDKVMASR